MKFGIYIHIPYCIQRCPYCDFATYQKDQILPPQKYVQQLIKEIEFQSSQIPQKNLESIYFGGGTPSLLEADDILAIIRTIEKVGFTITEHTEVTIEINPGTIAGLKLDHLLAAGINRFSVGAQTFNRSHIKSIGREHNELDTLKLLRRLSDRGLNFSADLLFALPGQTLAELQEDLTQLVILQPPHISPYCLTVAEHHPMSKGQPVDEIQIEMFSLIYQTLKEHGYIDYEISNFAKPGFESKHNLLYWTDNEYLGFGLSAHSFLKHKEYGIRFWNPRNIDDYLQQSSSMAERLPWENLAEDQFEVLNFNEALTDYCHTALRTLKGLEFNMLQQKFGKTAKDQVIERVKSLAEPNYVEMTEESLSLTFEGRINSNKILEILHFSN